MAHFPSTKFHGELWIKIGKSTEKSCFVGLSLTKHYYNPPQGQIQDFEVSLFWQLSPEIGDNVNDRMDTLTEFTTTQYSLPEFRRERLHRAWAGNGEAGFSKLSSCSLHLFVTQARI